MTCVGGSWNATVGRGPRCTSAPCTPPVLVSPMHPTGARQPPNDARQHHAPHRCTSVPFRCTPSHGPSCGPLRIRPLHGPLDRRRDRWTVAVTIDPCPLPSLLGTAV
eukprot:gene14858-biopygen21675